METVFRYHQYLGSQERKRLAREMQLWEVQIKTWFQNPRMKHKGQMQDSQLNSPFSESLHASLAFHSLSSGLPNGLQLLCSRAPLPRPQALMLPPWLLLGSLPSGTRSPGLCMGFLLWAASGVPSPKPRKWRASARTSPIYGALRPVCSAGDKGCILSKRL